MSGSEWIESSNIALDGSWQYVEANIPEHCFFIKREDATQETLVVSVTPRLQDGSPVLPTKYTIPYGRYIPINDAKTVEIKGFNNQGNIGIFMRHLQP